MTLARGREIFAWSRMCWGPASRWRALLQTAAVDEKKQAIAKTDDVRIGGQRWDSVGSSGYPRACHYLFLRRGPQVICARR